MSFFAADCYSIAYNGVVASMQYEDEIKDLLRSDVEAKATEPQDVDNIVNLINGYYDGYNQYSYAMGHSIDPQVKALEEARKKKEQKGDDVEGDEEIIE